MNMKYVKFYKGNLSVLSLGQTFFFAKFSFPMPDFKKRGVTLFER